MVFRLGFLRRLKVLLKRCLKTFRPKLLVKSFAFRPLAKRNCSSGTVLVDIVHRWQFRLANQRRGLDERFETKVYSFCFAELEELEGEA